MKNFIYKKSTTIKEVGIEDIDNHSHEMLEIRLRTQEQLKKAIGKGVQVFEKTITTSPTIGREIIQTYYFINVDFEDLLETIKKDSNKKFEEFDWSKDGG